MLKLHVWFRIAAIILVILLNLMIGFESAAGAVYTGNLSSGPGASNPSSVTYQIPAVVGDTLNVTLDYSGYNTCGGAWVVISFNRDTPYPMMTYSYGGFTGSATYTYTPYVDGDVALRLEVACRHATSVMEVTTLDYTMTVTVNAPPPPNENPYAAEEAAGLQRLPPGSELPVVIYTPTAAAAANGDLFIDIWQLDEHGVGQPFLYISEDELLGLPELPVENILIASDGLVKVYKLRTGEYQVNIGPLADGKIHVRIFDNIPPTHVYGYTLEVE